MLDNLKLLFIWAPVMNVQLILDGIFIGAVFALTAYGLALVWGVMNIKNLAQGDFVIMGGYLSFALFNAGFKLLTRILKFIRPLMILSPFHPLKFYPLSSQHYWHWALFCS